MSTQVQYRRGSNVQVAAFTGALGEMVIDTTNKIVVVQDGATAGGFPGVGLTATQTITNKIYQGTSLSVSGNVTAGNLVTSGAVVITGASTAASYSATGNITGGNLLSGGLISTTGNATHGNILTAGLISATGAITGAAITGSSLTVGTGTITGGNIVNSNANGVGNIGSSTTYFNTVFAKATSAQYADLAEMYCADSNYTSGTVVEFGGTAEVTATTESHSTRVAGIISTNPSYLMNATIECENAVEVALTGRVPCYVVGSIRKGDRLVASKILGVAQAMNTELYQPGCIVGKALENYNSNEVGTIEVAVGRT